MTTGGGGGDGTQHPALKAGSEQCPRFVSLSHMDTAMALSMAVCVVSWPNTFPSSVQCWLWFVKIPLSCVWVNPPQLFTAVPQVVLSSLGAGAQHPSRKFARLHPTTGWLPGGVPPLSVTMQVASCSKFVSSKQLERRSWPWYSPTSWRQVPEPGGGGGGGVTTGGGGGGVTGCCG